MRETAVCHYSQYRVRVRVESYLGTVACTVGTVPSPATRAQTITEQGVPDEGGAPLSLRSRSMLIIGNQCTKGLVLCHKVHHPVFTCL